MNKLLVNITTWIGHGGIHYYAKIKEFETDENIYVFARNFPVVGHWDDLLRILVSQDECDDLTKRDGRGAYRYKVGDETHKFNSIEEIKETIEKEYPKNDVAFLHDHNLRSEDLDIIERTPLENKKTGKQIIINGFHGFSSEFKNLTEGSIHDVIETPERYKDPEHNIFKGVWVQGVTEPVKVLIDEFDYVK